VLLINHVEVAKVLKETLEKVEEEQGDNMPYGQGTYGSKKGRPPKKKKRKKKKK